MIDMTKNRVPYGLLTDEEKAALREHNMAGGEIMIFYFDVQWNRTEPAWSDNSVYRTVPLPLT